MKSPSLSTYPLVVLGSLGYLIALHLHCSAFYFINNYMQNHYYHVKDHYQISLPPYFHLVLTPSTNLLMQLNVQLQLMVLDHDDNSFTHVIGERFACERIQPASEDAIERGRAGANDPGLVSAVGRARRPPQPRPSARPRISMRWRAIWRRARIAAL